MGGLANTGLLLLSKQGDWTKHTVLVEVTGIQPHYPDFASPTPQSTLLFCIRDTATFVMMELNDQVKISGKEDKIVVSKCKFLCSSL